MEDNLKNLTIGEDQVTPVVPEVQNIRTPEMFVPENPFKELNLDKLTSTSQPQYQLIGLSDAAIDRGMALGKQKLEKDPFIQAQRFEAPSVPGFQAALQSDYFQDIGVFPGIDVEETYGTAQTNWNKISNAIVGAGSLAANQIKDQFLSWGDTIDMFKGDSPFKQSELEAINDWQNDFNNKYHIFQTQEDRNTFWNVSNFSNMIQQSGYAIGAVLEIAAEEFALSALTAATFGGASEIQAARSMQLAGRIGKVIGKTRQLESTLQNPNALRKIFNNSVAKFVNLTDTGTFLTSLGRTAAIDQRAFGAATGALRTTARGFGAFYRDMRMINAGITEAKATVAPVMAEAYEMAVEEYKKVNGFEPSEELKQKLKQKAFETVQTEGAVQAAWIALTDKVAFDGILRSFKATRFLDDDLVAKGIFTNTKKAIKEGGDLFVAKKGISAFTHQLKTSPFKTLIKFPITYAKTNVIEGLQETGQDVIDSATKQWYMYNYGTEEQRKNQKGINDFLYAGAKEQLTMDGLKTFMSGFLTGGIMNVLGGGIRGAQSLYERTINKDGYKSSVQRADEERNKLVGLLNQSTNNKTDFYRSLVELDGSMRGNAKEGRKKEYWDNRNDFINKYVLGIIKSGVDDVVIDRMKEAIKDLSVEEFKQAYQGSLYEGLSEEQSKNVMTGLVNTFESKVKEVKQTYEQVRDNYGNPYNPKNYKIGTPEYNQEVANYLAAEEAINQISFSKSTYLDVAKRQKEILTEIKNNFPNISFNSLYSLTSPSLTLKKELEILEKEYEATSDPKLKEEKKQKIDTFNKYKESVEKYAQEIEDANFNLDVINEIKSRFLAENSEVVLELLKLDNPDTTVVATTDVINKAVGDIFDYLRLQTDYEDAVSYFNTIANPNSFESLHQAHLSEMMDMMGDTKMYEDAAKDYIEKNPKNNKHFVLRIKNKYVLFSPKGELVNKFETKEEADNIAEEYDEIFDQNANRVTIEVVDINGEPKSVEIIENNFYITEEGKIKKAKYPRNVIKIISIEDDVISYQVNYQSEILKKSVEDFGNDFGFVTNLKSVDIYERFFYLNRDKKFSIRVSKKYGKPHRLDDQDYTDTSSTVEATLVGEYTEDGKFILSMKYKNPNPKSRQKTITVPFDIKYYEKYALKRQPAGNGLMISTINKELLIQQSEQQRKQNIEDQQIALINLINRVESKLSETKAKREANTRRLEDLRAEMELLNEDLKTAEEFVRLNPPAKTGRRKTEYIKMMEKIQSFPKLIETIDATINELKEEQDALNEIYDSLVEARDNYYNALDSIERSKKAFEKDASGVIYGEEEAQLADLRSQLLTKRYSKEQVDKFVFDTEFEIEELKEIIQKFEKFAIEAKDIWKKLSKYIDIIDILNSDNSKKWLTKYLKEEEEKSQDDDKIEFLKFLRRGIVNNNLDFQIAKELAGGFKNAKEAFNKINTELFPKLQRLQQASEQLAEYSELEDRLNFLKYIQDDLFEEVAYIEERRRIAIESTSAKKAENAKLNPDSNLVEIVNGDNLFVSEDGFQRPLLSVYSLYLTTGRHYLDKDDMNINMESGNARFFKFTDNVNIEGEDYFLMPYTKDNDPFGIVIDENDIKVVVVKHQNDEYIPVDITGQPIENPNANNIVYTSLRMNQEELFNPDFKKAVEWVESRFTTKGVTQEQISNMIYKYRDFVTKVRNNTKAGVEMYIPIKGKTVGKQVMLPKDPQTGLPQEHTLEGRLIEEKTYDYANLRHPNGQNIVLKVATDKSEGIMPGRLYMKRDDGQIFRVFNRQLTQDEKDNFIDLLKYLARLSVKEKAATTELTKEEKQNKENILTYFKGLIFWTTEDNKSESDNRFYINENGMLVRGSSMYDLNESIIEENRDEIVSELRHQVNNSLLIKTNTPFYQMTTDNEGNVIIEKEYSNYTEYLFKNGKPVVYTNVPLFSETDISTPQVKSSNIIFQNVDDDFVPIVNYKNQEPVSIPGLGGTKIQLVPGQLPKFAFGTQAQQKAAEEQTKEKKVEQRTQPVEQTTPGKIILTPGQPVKFQFGNQPAPAPAAPVETNSVEKKLEAIQDMGIVGTPVASETPKQHTEQELNEAAKAFGGGINIDGFNLGGTKPNTQYRLSLEKEVMQSEDFNKVVAWFKSKLPNIKVVKVAELIDGKAWGAFKNGVVYIYENAEIGTGFHEAFEAVWNAYLNSQEQNELIEEFRNREGKFTNPFTQETKDYSDASYYDVREMLAEEFRSYILSETNNIEIEEKGIIGKIKNFFKELWNTIKKFVGLSKKEKAEGESLINNLFNKINKGSFSNVRFARDISEMGTSYREVIPDTTQEFTTQFIDGLTSYFFTNLYNPNLIKDSKGNYLKLNIESLLTEDENNNKILRQLFRESMDNVYYDLFGNGSVFFNNYFVPAFLSYQKSVGRNLTEEENNEIKNQAFNLYNTKNRFAGMILNAFQNPTTVYTILKQSLQKYGIQFKEVEVKEDGEEVAVNELDVVDTSGIKDSIFIDPRRLTATSFKILVGSLTNDIYDKNNNTIVPKRNGLNLPELVDYDATLNLLLNELNGTYSRLKEVDDEVIFYDALKAMFDKLDQKYFDVNAKQYKPNFLWIGKLKNRLNYTGEISNYFKNQVVTLDDIKLIVGFEKSLMNKKNTPLKLIVDKEASIYSMNALESTNEQRIREEWQGELPRNVKKIADKEENNNQLLGIDTDGNIVFDSKSNQYRTFVKLKNNGDKNIDLTQALLYLKDMGFVFTGVNFTKDGKIDGKIPFVLTSKRDKIIKAFKNIKNSIISEEQNSINNIFDLYSITGPEAGNVKDLIDVEKLMRYDSAVLTHTTASGETQYSITLPASINYILSSINTSETLEDFIYSNPQFGTVGYKDGEKVISIFPYQRNSELLKPGGLIYDEEGRRRNQIEYYLISGISSMDTNGVDTANLTYPDRVMQEINYMINADNRGLKPIYFTLINSDKSSEFGLSFSKPFISPTIAGYGVESPNFKDVINLYLNHLSDEIDAALMETKIKSSIQNYSKNVKYLGHFKDVLGFKTDKELKDSNSKKSALQVRYENVLSGKITKEEFLADGIIVDLIKKDLINTVDFTVDALVDLGIINKVEDNKFTTNAINIDALKTYFDIDSQNMSLTDVQKLVTYLTINKELAVTEQHKLLYGHPALYKDLAKRANGINSSKDAIVDNPHVISKLDNLVPRFDGKVRSSEKIQTFKNISFKDVTAVSNKIKEIAEGLYKSMTADEISKQDAETRIGVRFTDKGEFKEFILKNDKFTGEIKAYAELNEADGQGWIMPDLYRDMLFLSAKLSDAQLQQIDYEIAYEINARSNKPKTDPAYKEYKKGKYTLKWAQGVLEKGNPGVPLPVIKPQYFGYAESTYMMHTVFLKHSVQPKFYRSVEGTKYEKVYLAAQKNQIDVIGFESGEKVGAMLNPKTGDFVPFHTEDGDVNIQLKNKSWELPDGLGIQKLYTKYYGIQSEQPAIYKDSVVRGTQVTKLVMSNFKVDGKFVSEKAENLITRYNNVIDNIIKKGKEELLVELGITIEDGIYTVKDYTKMINLLRKELTKRDLPSNLIDALDVNPETKGLVYRFDTLANRDKIDNILNSIVDSRVISAKMFGKPAVQVASSGYNVDNRTMMYLKDGIYVEMQPGETLTEDQKKTLVPTSSDLKFYALENGKISKMEIYIPWYFEGIDPEDLGLKLKNGVYEIPSTMDKRLLNMIGFRIPTQGMNSIENIVVKGFLPRENGDMIVVPTEIVGKAGSDFDIDKMNLYIPNYVLKYSKFTKEEIVDFKKTPFFDSIPKSVKKSIKNLSEEQFVDLIEDLNNFSITRGKGKYGNLEEYLKENNITGEEYELYTEVKKALVDYNIYRRNIIKENKAKRKEFKPIVEDILYIESGQNTKESLQNELREIMEDLVSMPENYRQLVMPNSTATLKALATEINELKGKKDAESSMLALRKFIPSAETRERYLTGKRLVGIAALQSTSHIMSQIADIVLSGKYNVSRMEFFVRYNPEYKKEDGVIKKTIVINLTHNKKEVAKFYLNAKTDAEGRWISENISEALSGFVDAAKDPFVFSLNINYNTAGTWFYLQKLGVPMKEIAYLFNQPSVEKFMKLESKNNSIFKKVNKDVMFRENMFINAISEYMPIIDNKFQNLIANINKANFELENYENTKQDEINLRVQLKKYKTELFDSIAKLRSEAQKPNAEQLKNLISNLNNPQHKITKEEAIMQVVLLVDYLEYQDQAGNLTEFISAIGYDNKKTKTLIENQLQKIRWDRMLESGFIENPQSILTNTFIGEMKKQKEDLFSVFEEMFISLDPRAYPVFEKLYDFLENRKIFISNEDKSILINKYQKFFIAYVIQNTKIKINDIETTISDKFEELMKGENSIASQLQALKDSPDYNISQNLIVKELIPIFASNVNGQNNIKLFRNKMTTYKNDVLIESINNLLNYAKASGNLQLENFVNSLGMFSILQSGLQDSTINFTKVLPANLYSKLINEILNIYQASEFMIDPEMVWQQFHQNNKFDRNIVKSPRFKKVDKFTGNILLDVDYSDAEYEFISITNPKRGIKKDEIDKLIRNKKGYDAFDYYVYKRTGYQTDPKSGKTFAVYTPLIPLGDGRLYTETAMYNITESKIDKNNIVKEGRKVGSVYEDVPVIKSTEQSSTSFVVTEQNKALMEQFIKLGQQLYAQLNPSQAAVAPNVSTVEQPKITKKIKGYGFESVSIAKEKYTRELVRKNPDIAYIYTENTYSLTAFPDKEGKGTAVIRPELNAYAIVTKKKYDYDTKENVDYSNSESDFEEFKSVNTELIQKIKQSGKSKVVFPEGFGTGLAKMPTRFAEWLQNELYNNFGLVTELDKTKTGLISKGVTIEAEAQQEKTLKLMDGNSYPISQINSELLQSIGYTPLQIGSILKTIC